MLIEKTNAEKKYSKCLFSVGSERSQTSPKIDKINPKK
jgi:hypothetical protein